MQQLPLHLPKQRASKKKLFDHPDPLNSANSSPNRNISGTKLANSELNTTSVIYSPHEKENISQSLRHLLDENYQQSRSKTSSVFGIAPSPNVSAADESISTDAFKLYKGRKSYLQDRFKAENKTLNNKHSKLDLLDDTKLTSFPLPHPQPNYNIYSNTSSGDSNLRLGYLSHETNSQGKFDSHDSDSLSDFHQLVLIEDYVPEPKSMKRKNSNKKSGHKVSILDLKRALINEENQSKKAQDIDFDDFSHTDSQIEYSSPFQSFSNILTTNTYSSSVAFQQDSFKSSQIAFPSMATSIATTSTNCNSATTNVAINIGATAVSTTSLRKRLEEVNALGSLISQKRNISDNSELDQESGKTNFNGGGSSTSQYSTEAYLDSILNKDSRTKSNGAFSINNATSSLKYCIMCEKPLYDISSLIPMEKKFEEIICSDCFEDYEKISNALSVIPEEELAQQLYSIEDTFEDFLDSQQNSAYGFDNNNNNNDDDDDDNSENEEDFNNTIVVEDFLMTNDDIIHPFNPNFSTLATKSQHCNDDTISFTDNLIDRLRRIQNQDAQMANRLALNTGKTNGQKRYGNSDVKAFLSKILPFNNKALLLKTYRTIRLIRRLMFGD